MRQLNVIVTGLTIFITMTLTSYQALAEISQDCLSGLDSVSKLLTQDFRLANQNKIAENEVNKIRQDLVAYKGELNQIRNYISVLKIKISSLESDSIANSMQVDLAQAKLDLHNMTTEKKQLINNILKKIEDNTKAVRGYYKDRNVVVFPEFALPKKLMFQPDLNCNFLNFTTGLILYDIDSEVFETRFKHSDGGYCPNLSLEDVARNMSVSCTEEELSELRRMRR